MAKKLQKSDCFSPIFNRMIDLCENNNITITTLLDKFTNSRSTINAWKNGNISTELLPNIAKELNVSLDMLLTGEEKNSSEQKLSKDQQRLLHMYSLLSDIEKGEILGELKAMTKDRMIEKQESNIQTVLMAARSFDNHPPELVTGDFSDILNAPDSTDEY